MWERFFIAQTGGFEIGGVLKGIEFTRGHQHNAEGSVLQDILTLTKDGYRIRLINNPSGLLRDSAYVNDVLIELESSDFYEGQISTQSWDKLPLGERLRHIWNKWESILNVQEVKTQAWRLKTPQPDLQKSLDVFVVK